MADADGSVVIVFDSDVSDAEKKIGRLKTEIQNLKTEISEKEFKHDTISEQAGAMEAKINDAKKAVADYEQELISIQTKIGKTPTTGEGNRAEYQQLHKQYDIIEQKLAAQRETVKNLEPEWEKLVNSADKLAASIQEDEQSLAALRYAGGELTKQVDAEKSTDGEADEAAHLKEISESAVVANQHVVDLQQELSDLKARQMELQAAGVGLGYEEFDGIAVRINEINQELREYRASLSEIGQEDGETAAEAASLREIGESAAVSNPQIVQLRQELEQLKARQAELKAAGLGFGYEEFDSNAAKIAQLNSTLREYESSVTRAADSETEAGSAANSMGASTDALKEKMGGGLKSVLTYGLGIRSLFALFNKMRSAIKEGFQNLAQADSTTSNSISALTGSLTQLKNSLATAFTPIVSVVAPILTTLINLLSKAATYVGMFFAALSGQKTFTKATAVQEDYADSLESTAGAAEDVKQQFSGLDEITTWQDDSSGGGGGASASNMFEEVAVDNQWDGILAKLNELKNLVSDGFWAGLGDYKPILDDLGQNLEWIKRSIVQIFSDPAVSTSMNGFAEQVAYALGQVAGSVASIGLTIAQNLVGGIALYLQNNTGRIQRHLISMCDVSADIAGLAGNFTQAIAYVFGAIGEENGQQLTGNLIGIFADAFMGAQELCARMIRDIIGLIVQPFIDNADDFRAALDEFLGVVAEVAGTVKEAVDDVVDGLIELYDEHIAPFVANVTEGLSEIWDTILDGWSTYIQPILEKWAAKFEDTYQNHLKPVVDVILEIIGKVIDIFNVLWTKVLQPLIQWIVKNVFPVIAPIMEAVGDVVGGVVDGILDFIAGLLQGISGIIDFVVDVFNGDWESAWEDGLGVVKSVVNGILAAIEAMVNGVVSGVNAVIGAINGIGFTIPDWVPSYGGKRIGFNISKIKSVSIPRLATGAVIPPNREFMAVLGDQKHGTNIEAPLATIEEAVENVLRRNGYSGNGKNQYNVTVNARGKQLLQIILEEGRSQQMQSGSNPFLLGQGG